MLISIATILLSGLLFGAICKVFRIPGLFGMILAGILNGPSALNWISPEILNVSGDLRKIALIIILIRAGLKLELNDLKRVGRPAVLMCFLPATFEMLGMIILAPKLLGMNILDAAILGAVVGAVSPAVIVPKMIHLIDEKYGTAKGIPQMILAGASVDDVYVIVLFTTFTGMAKGEGFSMMRFVKIPLSVATGAAAGFGIALLFVWFFKKIHMRDTIKIMILISIAFIITSLEEQISLVVPFASLIAVMSIGLGIRQYYKVLAERLSYRCDRLWVVSEIFLFVLVGASVAIDSVKSVGFAILGLLFGVLLFRMAGVFLCLLGTNLDLKEKVFCMLAYTPKATVQAAIGGLPLAMGLACGEIVLTVSVIAILVTAPLGAFAIDLTYKKLLSRE